MKETTPRLNSLLGLDYDGDVVLRRGEADMAVPAYTSGNVITLNPRWFGDHPDDEGAVVHELVHVIMHCPRYDSSNWWLIEGIADYGRDKLGYVTPWSSPHKGDPKSGYQATAHFLLYVEGRYGSDYIKSLAKTLSTTGDVLFDIESKIKEYLSE